MLAHQLQPLLPPPPRAATACGGAGSSSRRQRAAQRVRSLKDNVAALEPIDDVERVLLTPLGHAIPNAPGKKASVAIYAHLAAKYGGRLDAAAAQEGLALYDEVVQEAVAHPGSHPNIDVLLNIVAGGEALTIVVEPAVQERQCN